MNVCWGGEEAGEGKVDEERPSPSLYWRDDVG